MLEPISLTPQFKKPAQIIQEEALRRERFSKLSSFHLEVLDTLSFFSIKVPLSQLAQELEVEELELLPVIKELESLEILHFSCPEITVEKKARKYLESRLDLIGSKSFSPQHLQMLWSLTPPEQLYSIYPQCNHSDTLINVVLERYFKTPRIYQSTIFEICHLNPDLKELYQALEASETGALPAEEFSHELIVKAELALIAGLVYEESGSDSQKKLKQKVVQISPWREYQQKKQLPTTAAKEMTLIKREQNSSSSISWQLSCELERLPEDQWIALDDFYKSFTHDAAGHYSVTLNKKAGKWCYLGPELEEGAKAKFNQELLKAPDLDLAEKEGRRFLKKKSAS